MYKTEYHSSLDASNKYEYKHPLVLSLLRQVTLHGVRSKILNWAGISKIENKQTQTR